MRSNSLREGAPPPPREAGADDHQHHNHRLLIGAREAARLLGIGERLLAELTSDGSLPSRKIGARRLYSVAELDAWIARGCPRRRGGGA